MRTIIIDSQILTAFMECSEKYDLMFIQNLKSMEVVDPLVKGDVLHTGLEAYYRHLKKVLNENVVPERKIIHEAGVEISVVEMRAKAALNGINLDLAEEVIKTTLEYFEFYKDDDLIPLEIEEPFIKEIYANEEEDLRILYAGKIDLIATSARYQWKPTPFDNKSTTRNSTPSSRSNQFFGYTDALDSNLLVINRIGFQKSLSAAERFKRLPVSYPPEYREKWRRETVVKWGRKLAWALDNQEFEENISSCDKFSGCTFKKICESITPEAREWVIQSQYVTGDSWDITRSMGKKNA